MNSTTSSSTVTTLRVTVRFFALLREQAGCRELVCDTAAATPRQLFRELAVRLPLKFPEELLGVAINEVYVGMDALLCAHDRVVFIPPVAGG